MKCPKCDTELVVSTDFPSGISGALVRIDCPKSFCSAPLVARVSGNRDPDLELMTREEGIAAAREKMDGAPDRPPFVLLAIIVPIIIIAIVFDVTGWPLTVLALATIVSTLAGAYVLRRRAIAKNTQSLLDALPHLPRALEPKPKGYRDG